MVQGRYIQGETLGLADEFLAFSGSVLRQHRFGAGLTGSVEARFQWGDDGLPTSERLALGGVQSLRGYAESDVLSDKGYLVRSELAWMPFFEMRPAKPRTLAELGKDFVGSMESFVFLDHGMGIDIELFDASTENRVLTSAGAGLRFAISRFFSLMAVYAQPFDLEDEQEEENFLFRLELRLPWG